MPDPIDNYARDFRHHQDRSAPSITLRSRSQSQDGKKAHEAQKAPLQRARGIQLYPRARVEPSSAMTTTAYREQSQSEAESAQVPSLVQLLWTSLIGHDHLKKEKKQKMMKLQVKT